MAGVSQTDEGAGSGEGGRTRRLLVVAAEALTGAELRERVKERLQGGSGAAVHVVAPALAGTAFAHAMGDVDEAREVAQKRLDESMRSLGEIEAEVTGTVGDSDPLLAIEDALQTFDADEILIATHPDEEAGWLEEDLFDRARKKLEPPVTHVVVERAASGEGRVADVERSGRGADELEDKEVSGRSRNLPAMSAMDLAGIVVAIVGTIVLVVLAASCPGDLEEGGGSDMACAIRTIIAGAFGLINIAHIVGLVLFQSVRYRGGWESLFAKLSLFGTPVAIVVCLLIG